MIAEINRAAAVGRLMMGRLLTSGWQDFLKDTEPSELSALPRQRLREAMADVRKRLAGDVDQFCHENFTGMTVEKLAALHGSIKRTIPYGLRMPLSDFEKRFGAIRPKVLRDAPPHSTIWISLWGLQFEYPEHHFMSDIEVALRAASAAKEVINSIDVANEASERKDELKDALQLEKANCRAGLLACFNLVEAYLNGLAWRFVHTRPKDFAALSASQKKLINDSSGTKFRDKLIKYPEILAGTPLWTERDDDVDVFLSLLKPFRDSLCHPSPFQAPEKFGGYDKLTRVYNLTLSVFSAGIMLTLKIIERLHGHIDSAREPPHWISLRVTTSDAS